jgi:hypothetical protein
MKPKHRKYATVRFRLRRGVAAAQGRRAESARPSVNGAMARALRRFEVIDVL